MTDFTEYTDLREKGRGGDGQPTAMDRRLYMQFLAYGNCGNTDELAAALTDAGLEAALYADLNDPRGVGLLTVSEEADFFVTQLRSFLNQPPFAPLTPKPEMTMFGRTYSIGYEPDLVEALIDRPKRKVLQAGWDWAVWYPLRRVKSFELVDGSEQRHILGEHGAIGRAFGQADLATDIRLACHGLDKNDNDFVVSVLAHQLHAASAVVQTMRKTQQTSKYLESLGPFFIGKVIWRSKE